MRVLLLYNPHAGKNPVRRLHDVEQVCAFLNAHGCFVEATATISAGSAGHQVRQAITSGVQCIFACGGDGTIHDVLQGIVDESCQLAKRPLLGIIPMGSANAFARSLRLSMKPLDAVRQQIDFASCEIPVGKIEYAGKHRYFIVMAGAGPAGLLVYKTLSSSKRRLGRTAYYVRAACLFAFQRFPSFNVILQETGQSQSRTIRSVSALAVRVDDLGGLFSRLTGTAEIYDGHLRLMTVLPPGWLTLPLWFVMGWLGANRFNPLGRLIDVDNFVCEPGASGQVHIQADGEWIGTAPMRVTLVQNAVQLLVPVAKH